MIVADPQALRAVRRQLEAFRAADVMRPAVASGRSGRLPLPDQCLAEGDSLSAVVHVLTRYETAAVIHADRLVGHITRRELETPIGRMWLFGMLTLIELDFTARIQRRWPQGGWEALLAPGRLEVAVQLYEERRRIGDDAVALLDCLQLSDKGQILIQLDDQREEWGFRSQRIAKAAIKELASLRNHLMHAQPLVGDHWPQIARLARRFDEILCEHFPGDGKHA